MTLKQAFTMWACAPRNTVLAAKSRDAVQRVLMKKYNDVDLETFTEDFSRRIFTQSSESQELKVKAASILVYLLQWGGDNGHCKRPTFTYEIATATKEKPKQEDISIEDTDLEAPHDEPTQEPTIEVPEDKPETKEEQTMTEKKPRGKQPIPVAQIDPETLKLVKVWPSRCEAERGTGACNIDRAIAKKRMAGGFFWCMPDDAEGFKPNPLSNRAPKSADTPNPKIHLRKPKVEVPVKNDITQFSDQEIIDEIKRRGWQGNITMTINITL